jgi:uncharacterized membrane protein
MARDVIIAAFDTRNQAYDAANDINRLSNDGVVEVKSGAIIEKDPLGNVSELDSQDLPTAWGLGGAAGGALVGALVGLLAGPGGAAAGTAAGAAAASSGAAAGAIGGGATGTLADLTNWGLKADYLDTAAAYLVPGKTAVVAEVEEGSTGPIDAAVLRHGGIIYREAVTI